MLWSLLLPRPAGRAGLPPAVQATLQTTQERDGPQRPARPTVTPQPLRHRLILLGIKVRVTGAQRRGGYGDPPRSLRILPQAGQGVP